MTATRKHYRLKPKVFTMKNIFIGIILGGLIVVSCGEVWHFASQIQKHKEQERSQRDAEIANLPPEWQKMIFVFWNSRCHNSVLLQCVPIEVRDKLLKSPLTDEQAHFIARLGQISDEGGCYLQLMPYIKTTGK